MRTLFLLLLISPLIFPQFEIITPKPTVYDITGIKAFTEEKYLICTLGGEIFRTEDGGLNWSLNYKDSSFHLSTIFFVNETHGWAAGNKEKGLLKTTDGGYTWTDIPLSTNKNKIKIFFSDINYGFFITESECYKTNDGGTTWNIVQVNATYTKFIDLYMTTSQKIFLLGGDQRILRSVDSGTNWSLFNPNFIEAHLKSVCFFDTLRGCVVGDNLNLAITTDGGDTWFKKMEINDYDDEYLYTDAEFRGNNGIFLSYYADLYKKDTPYWFGFNAIVRTTDKGETWVYKGLNWYKFDTPALGLSFINDSTYIACGKGGAMFKTSDLGETVQMVNNFISPGYLGNPIFLSKDKGYMQYYMGILKTEDGFKTFDSLNVSGQIQNFVSYLEVINPDTIFLLHSNGDSVSRSINGGLTWEKTYIAYNNQLASEGMEFTSDTVGYIATNSNLLKTTDTGDSWFPLYTGIFRVYKMDFVDDLNGWFTSFGYLYRTRDGGLTWELTSSITSINNISMYDTSIGIGCTSSNVYYTLNGGYDWQEGVINCSEQFHRVFLFKVNNDLIGYLTAYTHDPYYEYKSSLYVSLDTGKTWQPEIQEFPAVITNLCFKDNILWAITGGQYRAVILKKVFEPTPVNLISFIAEINRNNITLFWQTASEKNNKGFEIQRFKSNNWEVIGFVEGKGTTTEKQNYTFTDEILSPGNYQYRLKQIDFDGTFEYSNEIEVTINIPYEYSLSQNYPNPFNPSTKIKYTIAQHGNVLLKLFDVLGNEIAVLVNKEQEPGEYEIDFNAGSLASGIYFYKLKAGEFGETRKMVVVK